MFIQSKKKPRKSLFFRLVIVIFVLYAAVTLVDTQVQIADKRRRLETVRQQTEAQRLENKDIERQLKMSEDENNIERIAREKLDYVSPDERVFVDISVN